MSTAELQQTISDALKAADAAASGSAAEEARALSVLKLLQKYEVTTELLRTTEGGKRINKLKKHANPKIAEAAGLVVDTWKDRVRQEAEQAVTTDPDNRPPTTSTPVAATSTPSPKPSPTAPSNAPKVQTASLKPKSCGDPTRDKLRAEFAKALEAALVDVPDGDPCSKAVAIEEAMFAYANNSADAKYKAKFRTLAFNLKDVNNPDLRRNVLEGVIPPERLMEMSAEDMASNARKQENQKMRESRTRETERGGGAIATTDAFKCGKCKQSKCTYFQMQTRSADEPMTTFVTCTVCGNKWKFC